MLTEQKSQWLGKEDIGMKPWQALCLDDSLITMAFT